LAYKGFNIYPVKQLGPTSSDFLPRDASHGAVMPQYVVCRPSVRLSVCLSVRNV